MRFTIGSRYRGLKTGILALSLALLPLSATATVFYTIDLEGDTTFGDYGAIASSGNVTGRWYDHGIEFSYQLKGRKVGFPDEIHGVKPSLSTDARAGDYALLLEVPALNHAESGRNQIYQKEATFDHGQDRYTGFSVKIDPATFPDPTDWMLLVQWHQKVGGSPPVELDIKKNGAHTATEWQAEIVTRTDGSTTYGPYIMIPKNEWVDFVVHTRLQATAATGTVQVWMKKASEAWDASGNGTWETSERRVVNIADRKIGYDNSDTLSLVKYAVYRGSAGGQWERSHKVLFDEIRFGTTRDEVANASGGVTITPATGFYNEALLSPQAGTFTAEFDVVPSANPTDSLVSLSSGNVTAYSGMATIVRFNVSGNIDARNGGSYAAAATIPYTAGVSYHFRLVINVPAHTYSIYVTPAGGSEQTVGLDYAFRTEQNAVASLDKWNARVNTTPGGSITVSNFAIASGPPAEPSALAATAVSYNQINLAWSDVANETGYKIERRKGAGGTYAQIGTTGANATSYSDTTCGAGTNYYYRVRANNGNGDSGYSNEANATTHHITSGRRGHWKLDGNATDSSGNANDGTVSGTPAPAWVAGKIGSGAYINGGSGMINALSGTTLDNLGPLTITAWIKVDSTGGGGFGRIVDKARYRVHVRSGNQLQFVVDYTGTNSVDLSLRSANDTFTTGVWTHVTVTWAGTTEATDAKMYVDATEVTYSASTSGSGTLFNDGSANFYIGNHSAGDRAFDGVLDDVRVFNRVLTTDEITAIYRAGL